MKTKHFTEEQRLEILGGYNILDTLPEKDFDDITHLASVICQTPISLITLVDENRQWFKSRKGLPVTETPRVYSICSIAIQTPDEPCIVYDARKDSRFSTNPFVHGEPFLTFYAGIPLVNPEGYPLGTLCIMDHQPKELTEHQISSLKALANQVTGQLELRRKIEQLKSNQEVLQTANKDLESFAHALSHDIKGPLKTMHSYSNLVQRNFKNKLGEDGAKMLGFIQESSTKLLNLVDGILDFSQTSLDLGKEKESTSLNTLIEESINLLQPPEDFTFEYKDELPQIITSKSGLQQILLNLLSNAIKYNDKKKGVVKISFDQDEHYYKFQVSDNGLGICAQYHDKIFEILQTLGQKDRFGNIGNGIGLATVKRIVDKLNGDIEIVSTPGEGTTFSFSIAR